MASFYCTHSRSICNVVNGLQDQRGFMGLEIKELKAERDALKAEIVTCRETAYLRGMVLSNTEAELEVTQKALNLASADLATFGNTRGKAWDARELAEMYLHRAKGAIDGQDQG